jgi:hypothetical protein
MPDDSYRDLRSAAWAAWYGAAASYEAYLAASDPARAEKWRELEGRLPALAADESRRLRGYHRRLHLLLVSGVWCGDCVRQGPIIRQIAAACDDEVELRVVDRDRFAPLRDEVRILGAARVPVLVFLSEDFFELGRFGDRTLTTYRLKASSELGPACPVPAVVTGEELSAERAEWLDVFERMLLMARLAPALRKRHDD